VARAKRTARADARRRYRVEQGLVDETAVEEEAPTAPTATRATGTPQPQRIGIGAAFKQAFRPLEVRGDLRALPSIARHSKALWVPVLLTAVTAIAYAVVRPATRPADDGPAVLVSLMASYFLVTPAIGGVFIAGFLAPRASWLLGAIVGMVSAAAYIALGVSGVLPTTAVDANGVIVPINTGDAIASALIATPVVGAIFASAAAWYRRFLQLSSPNRGRARQQPVKRGTDGRSRAGNQKAGARR
jgi:hypothetical protein